MPPRKDGKLTPKESAFIDEYMIDFNATRAAKAAGYSEKTAHAIGGQNLEKLEIKEEIERRQKERSRTSHLNEEWVLRGLEELYAKCMQHEQVKNSEGEAVGEYKFYPTTAAKALELIGKHRAMFTDVVKQPDIEKLSNDEVFERISRKLSELGIARVTGSGSQA